MAVKAQSLRDMANSNIKYAWMGMYADEMERLEERVTALQAELERVRRERDAIWQKNGGNNA